MTDEKAMIRAEIVAGLHPHTTTCSWSTDNADCDCGVDEALLARLDPRFPPGGEARG